LSRVDRLVGPALALAIASTDVRVQMLADHVRTPLCLRYQFWFSRFTFGYSIDFTVGMYRKVHAQLVLSATDFRVLGLYLNSFHSFG
jgi:hypothetical protein